MMMTNINHIIPYIQKHFRRTVFVCSLILFLIFPKIGSAGLFSYTIGESYSLDTYLSYCNRQHFEEKYSSPEAACWPCTVINALNRALLQSISGLVEYVAELSKLILLIGAAIWIAIYFLKSLSSLATQDSAKSLNGIFSFTLKVAFMYLLIDAGIAEIISWIVKPLLSIGMDVGSVIKDLGGS